MKSFSSMRSAIDALPDLAVGERVDVLGRAFIVVSARGDRALKSATVAAAREAANAAWAMAQGRFRPARDKTRRAWAGK